MAASRPAPGPRTKTSIDRIPCSSALFAVASAGADLGHALYVRGHLAPEVALDEDFLRRRHAVDDLAQARDLLLAQVLDPGVGVEVGGLDDLLRGGAADPVDVHQRDDHA